MIDKNMIQEMLWTNPVSLLAIKDQQVIDYLNNLIPYSTAFEIECDIMDLDNEEFLIEKYKSTIINHNNVFKSIPDIVSVSNDAGEQRYRIPNGLRGIICLYNISYQLKLNSLLNPLSGIHYHVDCTDCWKDIQPLVIRDSNWILSQLDKWLINGNMKEEADNRQIGSWFKLNDLQTIEFRMGEMTFDYKILLKRIIHCNSMVKKFKDELNMPAPIFEPIDSIKQLEYQRIIVQSSNPFLQNKILSLNVKLEKLKQELKPKEQPKEEQLDMDAIRQQIKSRSHKL